MKRSFIAAITTLSLIAGLAGAASATPITFPPEIQTVTVDTGSASADQAKSRFKKR